MACKGGTGTLVELAVVWEMLNKSVMAAKPFVVLGDFWAPILERVREVEFGHPRAVGRSERQIGAHGGDGRRSGGVSEARIEVAKNEQCRGRHKTFWNLTSCGNCCG